VEIGREGREGGWIEMVTVVMIEEEEEGIIGTGIEIETLLVAMVVGMEEEGTTEVIVGEGDHHLVSSSNSSRVRMTCGRTRRKIIGKCLVRVVWGRVN